MKANVLELVSHHLYHITQHGSECSCRDGADTNCLSTTSTDENSTQSKFIVVRARAESKWVGGGLPIQLNVCLRGKLCKVAIGQYVPPIQKPKKQEAQLSQ